MGRMTPNIETATTWLSCTMASGSRHQKQKSPLLRAFLFASLVALAEFGRRDWIRTNDPHHVKVVL